MVSLAIFAVLIHVSASADVVQDHRAPFFATVSREAFAEFVREHAGNDEDRREELERAEAFFREPFEGLCHELRYWPNEYRQSDADAEKSANQRRDAVALEDRFFREVEAALDGEALEEWRLLRHAGEWRRAFAQMRRFGAPASFGLGGVTDELDLSENDRQAVNDVLDTYDERVSGIVEAWSPWMTARAPTTAADREARERAVWALHRLNDQVMQDLVAALPEEAGRDLRLKYIEAKFPYLSVRDPAIRAAERLLECDQLPRELCETIATIITAHRARTEALIFEMDAIVQQLRSFEGSLDFSRSGRSSEERAAREGRMDKAGRIMRDWREAATSATRQLRGLIADEWCDRIPADDRVWLQWDEVRR